MLLERSAWFDRRTARWLVAWWVGSVVTLALLWFEFEVPLDTQPHLLSVWGLRTVVLISAAWLVPGFVLGGWKVLLVAAGRSAVLTGTDRLLMSSLRPGRSGGRCSLSSARWPWAPSSRHH